MTCNGTRRAPPPAFLVYAANLIVDRNHKLMALDERGLRITMMMECWCNGSIPSDTRELARVLGLGQPELEKALTARVMQYFEERDDVLVCPELLEYREHLDRRHAAQSNAGHKNIAKINERRRAARLNNETPDELPDGLADELPDGSLIQPNTTQPNPVFKEAAIPEDHKEWVDEFTAGEPDFARGPQRTKLGMRE